MNKRSKVVLMEHHNFRRGVAVFTRPDIEEALTEEACRRMGVELTPGVEVELVPIDGGSGYKITITQDLNFASVEPVAR